MLRSDHRARWSDMRAFSTLPSIRCPSIICTYADIAIGSRWYVHAARLDTSDFGASRGDRGVTHDLPLLIKIDRAVWRCFEFIGTYKKSSILNH